MVSLWFKPYNWKLGNLGYRIENSSEDMEVWIANSYYGVHFSIGKKFYGSDANPLGRFMPWRRKLYNTAMKRAVQLTKNITDDELRSITTEHFHSDLKKYLPWNQEKNNSSWTIPTYW